MEHEFKGWEAHHTVPTLELRFSFPMLHVLKERLILERDEFRRIIHSKSLD